MSLENLFKVVIQYGSFVRTNKLDGLVYWNKIKPLFSAESISCTTWHTHRRIYGLIVTDLIQIFNYVHGALDMKGDDNDETLFQLSKNDWAKRHFFLQLARIPKNSPELNLTRLMQVGYNVGQLLTMFDSYSPVAQEYFKINELNYVGSYVDIATCNYNNEAIVQITQQIKEMTVQDGGGYKQKYLKYKLKYINLKNKLIK